MLFLQAKPVLVAQFVFVCRQSLEGYGSLGGAQAERI
jgi:hypothetical protein